MDIKEVRALSEAELKDKLATIRKHLFELQSKRYGNVEKPHVFKQARRDIARILTILKEKK